MTPEELSEMFERHENEAHHFDRVSHPTSKRADLHAFMLLDKLVPEAGLDMVSAAEHDEIWLDVDVEKLAEVIQECQVIELRRCGIRYCSEFDCLGMFV
jgi:hypothetical protein